MKILLLDIETAPNLAYVWGLFDQNISPKQMESSSYVLCWAAKWAGDREMKFDSVFQSDPADMLEGIWKLLDEADVVVHYNGTKFDIPVLNKEFLKRGWAPPSPYKQVDLYRAVRRTFRFESNKLDYITTALGMGSKVRHEGFELWIQCMGLVPEAWVKMEAYNRQDVVLLESLYKKLLPWLQTHPSWGAVHDAEMCPKCGSKHFQARGFSTTATGRYQRYQCQNCAGWFRGNKSIAKKMEQRMVNI